MSRLDSLVLGVVVALGGYLMASQVVAPIMHGDEAGYLTNAQHIALGTGVAGDGYLAGYSLLLVPFVFANESPIWLYSATHIVNAMMLGATAVCVAYMVRVGWPSLSRGAVWLISGASVSIPGLLGLTGLAMSGNALMLIVAGSAALMVGSGRAESSRDSGRWLLLAGVVSGSAPAVNPRGLIILAAWAVAAVALQAQSSMYHRLRAIGVAFLVFVAGRYFNDWVLGDAAVSTPGTTFGLGDYVARVSDPDMWPSIVANIGGRIAYTSGTTFGFAWVGVGVAGVVLYQHLRKRGTGAAGAGVSSALGFVALGFVTTLVLSSVSMANAQLMRTDFLVYGRYVDIFLPLLFAAGLASVWTWDRSRSVRVGASVVLGSGLALGVARLAAPAHDRDVWLNRLNVLYVQSIQGVVEVGYLRSIGLGLILTTAVWLLVVWSRPIGSLVVLVLLLALSWSAYSYYLIPASQHMRSEEAVIAQRLVEMEDGVGVGVQCVAIDWPGISFWHVRNTQWFANRYDYRDGIDNDCLFVLTPRLDLDVQYPSAHILATETRFDARLWVRP